MNLSDDISTGDRCVCATCIGERYLGNLIASSGTLAMCHYCTIEGQTITIDELSEHVERAIEQHYARTASEPEGYEYYLQRETGGWERSGEPVAELVAQMLIADESIASDVQNVLDEKTDDWDGMACGEEQPFSEDTQYEEARSVDHASISEEYRQFEKVIVEQARYFSPETRHFLSSLFGQLVGLRTRDNLPVVVHAGPGKSIRSLFRARVFQDQEPLERALASPDRELGPPPPRLGRAGRLNATGVSIFYGADTSKVALNEVRPPVGSRVVIAQFELIRPLRLLDIDALKSLLTEGSIFDPEYLERLKRAAFLNSFSSRFTQVVMPDHETFEYIPTQAVADYLANEVEPFLDGILYSSTQSELAGKNVALFHRSSRVERRVTPDGMTTDVRMGHWTEDDYEIDYTVLERAPAPAASEPPPHREALIPHLSCDDIPEDSDMRELALRIDLGSVEVRHINAVEVRSETYTVSRSQQTIGQSPF